MPEFTLNMAALMESWGWRFNGDDPIISTHWAKYDGKEAVATFGDVEWVRDFLAARAVTRHEVLDDGIPSANLEAPVAYAMRAQGWRWALTGVVKGEWFLFSETGVCQARQGDWVWSQDLAQARAEIKELANAMAETCEAKQTRRAWEVTPGLRWRVDPADACYLQQAWRSVASGQIEWRDVKAVDNDGKPIV